MVRVRIRVNNKVRGLGFWIRIRFRVNVIRTNPRLSLYLTS